MFRYVTSGWLKPLQRESICVLLWRVCWSLTPFDRTLLDNGIHGSDEDTVLLDFTYHPPTDETIFAAGYSTHHHQISSRTDTCARTHTWCWIRTCCKHQAYCLLLQIPRTQLTQWKICSLSITNSCDIISYCCHNTHGEDVRGELSSPRRNRLLYWFGTVQRKRGLVWSLFNRDQILRKQHEQRTWKMNRHLNFNSVFTAAKLLNFFRPF